MNALLTNSHSTVVNKLKYVSQKCHWIVLFYFAICDNSAETNEMFEWTGFRDAEFAIFAPKY